MAYRILLRRDSSENWASSNTVLMAGEPGYVTDTGELKIGDGVTVWNSLAVYAGITGGTGNVGPTGNPGPTGAGGTGANTFYGSQTISGPSGTLILANYTSLGFTGDAPAAAAGIPLGGIYHDLGSTGSIRIRLT
jgi:hypothetical protein